MSQLTGHWYEHQQNNDQKPDQQGFTGVSVKLSNQQLDVVGYKQEQDDDHKPDQQVTIQLHYQQLPVVNYLCIKMKKGRGYGRRR